MILKDKVAVITGAGQGIGLAIAEKLASRGADVVIADVNLEKAEEAASSIASTTGRKSLALKANIASMHDAEEMVAASVSEMGGVHILVNNAGITRDALLMRMKEEDWDAVLDVNLKGVFNCTKAAVKYRASNDMAEL